MHASETSSTGNKLSACYMHSKKIIHEVNHAECSPAYILWRYEHLAQTCQINKRKICHQHWRTCMTGLEQCRLLACPRIASQRNRNAIAHLRAEKLFPNSEDYHTQSSLSSFGVSNDDVTISWVLFYQECEGVHHPGVQFHLCCDLQRKLLFWTANPSVVSLSSFSTQHWSS